MLATLETNSGLGQSCSIAEDRINEALIQMERNGFKAMLGAMISSDWLDPEEIEKTEADKAFYRMLEKDLLQVS